ncbi:hypothetical protein [Serratia sp. M24T3]|uniref:hypothetical protein n=1 Tax=Serratia sp. M24T3 TaxID=932213 RepID=UPI00025BB653|nr:hypothetical protein [Serratia sp. M24T3]EIC83344.1 hypothetical protein SPM24T3_17075 [Serratia sp. M24T3]
MTWLQTFTGKHLDYTNPCPHVFDKDSIAQGLSHECRFNGQIPQFYSVAQHSVLVSLLVPKHMAWEALLHDATEAFIKDIPAPLKLLLPDYKRVEDRLDKVIRLKYCLPLSMSAEVKKADLIMLATERRDFDMDDGTVWPVLEGITPADFAICPLNPAQARAQFLKRWEEVKPF